MSDDPELKSHPKGRLVLVAGFLYGLLLAVYATKWGVHSPTLTMAFAISPMNIFVSATRLIWVDFVMVPIVICITVAPFCWAALAHFAAHWRDIKVRLILVLFLLAHYMGIAIWLYVAGGNDLRWSLLVLRAEAPILMLSYVVGQACIWWSLVIVDGRKSPSRNSPIR